MQQLDFLQDLGELTGVSSDTFDYRPNVFTPADCARFMETFRKTAPWSQLTTVMYGKEIVTPRLHAWYGDANTEYAIDGKPALPPQWTPELLEIKAKVEAISGIRFNSVLLNYYRDHRDSVAWHSDRDGVPGKNRYVASVSFGQARDFELRLKSHHATKFKVLLESGSYLLMKGQFQDKWEHRIAKSSTVMCPRINLTFRITPTIA